MLRQKAMQQASSKSVTCANTINDACQLVVFRDIALGPANHFTLQALVRDRSKRARRGCNPLKLWENFKSPLQCSLTARKAFAQNQRDIALIDERQGRVRQDLFEDSGAVASPSRPKLRAIIAVKRNFDTGLRRSFHEGQRSFGSLGSDCGCHA